MRWYGWFFDCVKNKYFLFDGRARRSEYWYYILVNLIIGVCLGLIECIVPIFRIVSILVVLLLFAPTISVGVRRLHDTGRSGWWFILAFIPFVNLLLLYFFVLDSDAGANKYGENPKR